MKPWIYAVGFVLLGVALGVPLFNARRTNRELNAQVTRLSRQNADLHYELKQATRQAEEVAQRAVALDSQLGSAKSRTTATETKSVQLTRELTDTKSRLTEREQREVALMAELADLRQKVAGVSEKSRGEVAAAPVGARAPAPVVAPPVPVAAPEPAADVTAYHRRIAQLEEQLTQMLTRALAEPVAVATPEPPPAPAPHQVVRVGPRDSFVVIDYGTEHGARPNAIIRLRRGTSEVASVQISDARPRFSLAQVLPATLKGQLQTGDLVVFNN